MTAEDRGWGSGWPNCQRDKVVTVTLSSGVRLPVHQRIAPIVAWAGEETVRRGYWLKPDECWGFACRAIRGTSRPSNHSWALAVDLNSRANPMGDVLRTDMPRWMVDLWKGLGFRWGGDYRGRKDAMHYEFLGTPDDAARIARELDQRPGDEEDDVNVEYGMSGPRVEKVIHLLNNLINQTGGGLEGGGGPMPAGGTFLRAERYDERVLEFVKHAIPRASRVLGRNLYWTDIYSIPPELYSDLADAVTLLTKRPS